MNQHDAEAQDKRGGDPGGRWAWTQQWSPASLLGSGRSRGSETDGEIEQSCFNSGMLPLTMRYWILVD